MILKCKMLSAQERELEKKILKWKIKNRKIVNTPLTPYNWICIKIQPPPSWMTNLYQKHPPISNKKDPYLIKFISKFPINKFIWNYICNENCKISAYNCNNNPEDVSQLQKSILTSDSYFIIFYYYTMALRVKLRWSPIQFANHGSSVKNIYNPSSHNIAMQSFCYHPPKPSFLVSVVDFFFH